MVCRSGSFGHNRGRDAEESGECLISGMTSVQPFRVAVPDETLDRIRAKVATYAWHEMPDDGGWAYGTNLDYMKELCAYWLAEFDWRAQEAAINRFSQFTAAVDGIELHFIHEKGSGPAPLPLVISHGWPGSVVEFLDIIEPLAHPECFGGSAEDALRCDRPLATGLRLLGQAGSAHRSAQDGRPVRQADDRSAGLLRLYGPGRGLGRRRLLLARLRARTGLPGYPHQTS